MAFSKISVPMGIFNYISFMTEVIKTLRWTQTVDPKLNLGQNAGPGSTIIDISVKQFLDQLSLTSFEEVVSKYKNHEKC